jgi:hypothetical protein
VPVPGDAAFRETDQLYALSGRLPDEVVDDLQIRPLVAWGVLELDGRGAKRRA